MLTISKEHVDEKFFAVLANQLEKLVYGKVRLVQYEGIVYVLGEELSILRLGFEYKTLCIGCNSVLAREFGQGWYMMVKVD